MIQSFTVYDFPPTLNELNNMHFMKRAKLKEHWERVVGDAVLEWGIQPMDRVSITLEFYFPDKRRRDLDNYAFAFKFLQDALVKQRILTDDSSEEVVELRVVKGGISKPKRIIIHLVEAYPCKRMMD